MHVRNCLPVVVAITGALMIYATMVHTPARETEVFSFEPPQIETPGERGRETRGHEAKKILIHEYRSDEAAPSRARHVIDVNELQINRGYIPTAFYGDRGFKDTVFGILSDGIMVHRLDAALGSWLRDSFHTFIYFSDVSRSRSVASRFDAINTTVVLLKPPPTFRFGNWKNLPIIKHLASLSTQALLRSKSSASANWFVVADDDTYLLQPAVSYLLMNLTAAIQQDPQKRVFAGHTVMHCKRCRTMSKRFPFAFGGNGIFMSPGLLTALGNVVDSCVTGFGALPGDEQIGGCIHRHGLADLHHLSVGTETFSMAFGDKKEVLLESPFPFGFHRVTLPGWHADMRELEERHFGRILSWDKIAQYFMVEKADRYNTREHVFRETINSSAVQSYLLKRGV